MTLIGSSMLRCFAISIAIITFTVAASAQDWQARHAMSQAQFQTTFNDLTSKGYRLKCVSGYVSGGTDQYAALWIKAGGPAWVAHSSMTEAEFQQQFNDLTKQGYRLTWLSAHEWNGAARYEAIWEQKTGPAWEAKANLSATEYQQAFDTYTKQGYRPLHIWAYTVGFAPRFA